jgi:signal transduction histidine kinase
MPLTGAIKDFGAGMAAVYRRYAEWLVSITWKRFIVLSIVLLIVAGVLSDIPPFSWDIGTPTSTATRVRPSKNVDVTVDEHGVRITPKRKNSKSPEIIIDEHGVRIKRKRSNAAGEPPQEIIIDQHGVQVLRNPQVMPQVLPDNPTPPKTPGALAAPGSPDEEAGQGITQDIRREVIAPLAQDIRREVMDAIGEMGDQEHIVHVRLGNYLPQFAFLFILLSAAIKIAYAGRVKAEAKAAQAQEVAEAESLKRQVTEARMAAMQAQVEPHFLFNTLASIDHLIEVDPPRASRMQRNLIALLRASMPAMREKATNLGRELEVVRPYLEILKVRMEERLQAQVDVPEGLHSADFPPMMLQSLVENAIKHGLEPKADGGSLTVGAEVAHGKLHVSVADTGVGFARAATAGTGTGLTNIRERLKLIYGGAAELRIAPNAPTGTKVTIVVPYKAT